MLDDTGYFLPFNSYHVAYIVILLLNNNMTQKFLKAIAFIDSKRPYTKSLLQRLDFSKMVSSISYFDLKKTEEILKLSPFLTPEMYNGFVRSLNTHEQMLFDSIW